MLIFPPNLSSSPQTFADYSHPQIRYALPAEVSVATTLAGTPDFFLLRYGGDFSTAKGGLLRFQLALKALAESAESVRAVTFSQGYFRIRVRSPLTEEENSVGQWHPLILTGSAIATPPIGLSTHETNILQPLLKEGRNSVEVELDLRYQGLVSAGPWLTIANLPALKTHLLANLGTEAVRADQVVAAFLSLPDETSPVSWQSLRAEAPEPLREEILTETALRSLTTLFQTEAVDSPSIDNPPVSNPSAPDLYYLRPSHADDPSTFSWNLLTPRLAERSHFLTWQSSELKPYLTDPTQRQKLFPIVNQLALFGTTHIHVINHLPCDSQYLKEIRVSLRFSGVTGVPEYRSIIFNSASATLEQIQIAYPSFSPFKLEYQVTAVLAPPNGAGWPTLIKKDFTAASGTVIEINRHTVGMEIVRVSADPAVFDRCSAIAVALWPKPAPTDTPLSEDTAPSRTQLILTTERPTAWVALPEVSPDTPLQMRCVATPPAEIEQPAQTLISGNVVSRAVHIAAHQLEVLTPDNIAITSEASASQFAYVAVSLAPPSAPSAPSDDEGQLYPLSPGKTRHWPLFRNSIFAPSQFRYQIHYVAYDEAGQSLPIETTDWLTATGPSLLVGPPQIATPSTIQPKA